jgi:capsular polysaccharide biosynthesis protein
VDSGVAFDPGRFNDGMCPVRVYDTPAFLLTGPTDRSYGDWMINFPPRLALAEAAGLDCPIVIGDEPPPQALEVLAALGVGRDRLLIHNSRGVSVFPKLYAPSWPMRVRLHHMNGLFDVYRRAARPRPAPGANRPRLYLSRERIGKRPLVNEREVRALFESRGFRALHPQDMSLQEVRDAFANAACIAGPYGSAWLNTVYCSGKPACLVCMPPKLDLFLSEVIVWLDCLGLPFGYLMGEEDRQDGAWTLPLPEVERAIDRTLGFIGQDAGELVSA